MYKLNLLINGPVLFSDYKFQASCNMPHEQRILIGFLCMAHSGIKRAATVKLLLP